MQYKGIKENHICLIFSKSCFKYQLLYFSGEKYVMTIFGVLTFADQGMFFVVYKFK